MPEPIIVPGVTNPANDRQHSYFDADGAARYLIIMTPRLRELISALHAVPRSEQNEIMRRFDSEILE